MFSIHEYVLLQVWLTSNGHKSIILHSFDNVIEHSCSYIVSDQLFTFSINMLFAFLFLGIIYRGTDVSSTGKAVNDD